ncbi:colicin E5-related ribonuclease [Tepidibacillus marianensis]|uniref:colicin E5-related ribonuclease n=1 Tax=Tepidibacillus marianensis TaxID=3131995 RepID=UPI0030CB2521
MRKKLPVLLLVLIILLQAFVPVAYAVSKNDAQSQTAYFCPSDATSKGAGNGLKFGNTTKSAQKLANQMSKRGWSETTVRDTVDNAFTTRSSTNLANNNPATAYFNKDGSYVVVDNVRKEVVQISDKFDLNWKPDPNIINPYKP